MSVPLRFDQLDHSRQDVIRKNIATIQTKGGSDADVEEYLTKHEGLSPVAPQTTTAQPRGPIYNAINTADDALTFGMGKKINSAVNAGIDALRGRDTFSHSYRANLDAETSGLDSFRKENPYGAASVAGALGNAAQAYALMPLAATNTLAAGASLGSKMLAGAKTAAPLGALAGIGSAPADATPTNTMLRAGIGAAGAGAVGAGAVPLVEGATGAASRAVPAIRDALSGNRMSAPIATGQIGQATAQIAGAEPSAAVPSVDRASRLLINRLTRTGLTPSDALARLETMPEGKPVSMMEIAGDQSHPLRQLGKLVARTPSTGAADLRASVAQRSDPLTNAQRVLGDVSEATGGPRTDLVQNAAQLKGQQLGKAQPLYQSAMESPPVPLDLRADEESPSLADLFKRPSVKQAVSFHNDVAAERGEAPLVITNGKRPAEAEAMQQKLVEAGVPGDKAAAIADEHFPPPADGPVPLKSLQQIKFKLDDMLGFAKTRGTLPDGSPATNAKLNAINDTRKQLLAIMELHSPEYAQGNASWAGDAAVQNAGKAGRDFLSRPIDELHADFQSFSPGERAQHNVTAVNGPLRDRIFKTNAMDRAKILQSPDIQERMAVVTSPDRMAALNRNVGIEHQIAMTNQQIPGGSDTAENMLNQMDASSTPLEQGVKSLLTGGPKKAASHLLKSALESRIAARIQGVNENTANALAPRLSAGMNSREDLRKELELLAFKRALLAQMQPNAALIGQSAGVASGGLAPRR